MTLQEFEYHYRVATGMNYVTLQYIQDNIPTNYSDKIDYFIKLVGYIQLLKNSHFGEIADESTVSKYGRFDVWGNASTLSDILLRIIFGQSTDINNDESVTEYLVIAIDDLAYIDVDKINKTNLYLTSYADNGIYNGYKYVDYTPQFSFQGLFVIINTDNTYTSTIEAKDTILENELSIDISNLDKSQLSILYQVNTNTYLIYSYDDTAGTWQKTNTIYNDGDDTTDIGIQYLLDDDGEYILTDSGDKIII